MHGNMNVKLATDIFSYCLVCVSVCEVPINSRVFVSPMQL